MERRENDSPLSRRGFLGAASGLAVGVALGRQRAGGEHSDDRLATVPFYGRHQSGITTPPQRQGCFATFDVTAATRDGLAALLERWSEMAGNLCAGRPAAPLSARPETTESDSGAALGLGSSRLSVNFGFGPSLFGIGGPDRFSLRNRWPMALVPVPEFPGDEIAPSARGGDLTVHACADDPQVSFHALRQLARSAGSDATLRWAQAGFNETAAVGGTPRDLLGFKDGMINPTTDDELGQFVWVGEGQDQEWMAGGTYLVVRRIRILLDRWDAEPLETQEAVIGRQKFSGAPLGAARADDPLDLAARRADGAPAIPLDAHVRLAAPSQKWSQMLLRRSYAYNNGSGPLTDSGASRPCSLDAGLLFCAYQQDPRLAFLPIYAKLAARDALRHYTVHTASAVAALPPGAPGPGHYVGEGLFS